MPVFRKTRLRRLALRNTVVEFIGERLLDAELSVSVIVAELSISRSTLYRLFSEEGVDAYIRAERLKGARAEILSNADDLTIGEIAKRWCFYDGAHFTRSFKRKYGIRPGELDQID